MEQIFNEEQLSQLDQELATEATKQRKGGGGITLSYIEGHYAIEKANKIFRYGNWGYRPLYCKMVVIQDPMTGEAVGVAYKAEVELKVRGCVAPIVEVGSQTVAVWNVNDYIWTKRINESKNNHTELDKSEFSFEEIKAAKQAIMDAHENAEKGAVTDAMKRALRVLGNQFGNSLYGKSQTGNTQNKKPYDPNKINYSQINSIRNLSKLLGEPEPDNLENMSAEKAKVLIAQLAARSKEKKGQTEKVPA